MLAGPSLRLRPACTHDRLQPTEDLRSGRSGERRRPADHREQAQRLAGGVLGHLRVTDCSQTQLWVAATSSTGH